jgi:hypothetical protein
MLKHQPSTFLDCSPDDVTAAARLGRIRGSRVGRHWFFHVRDLRIYRRHVERDRTAGAVG